MNIKQNAFILYYSNYCENSKKLLAALTSNNKPMMIHFVALIIA